ncbi:MAG TPA: hypothetical protein VK656_07540, partial [Candidatus Acidoferrum sp.]|nr:hypothetical protein [Candidatus Acidoferrum sp.]
MTSRAPSTNIVARLATSPRLRPILTGLTAFVFLVGGTLPVAAQATTTGAARPVSVTDAPSAATIVERAATDAVIAGAPAPAPLSLTITDALTATAATTVAPPKKTTTAAVTKPIAKPAPPKIQLPPKAASKPIAFQGRNHVWIPSLGIDQSVFGFACTRSKEPDNLTYRWGCAGSNNVYLMGHAYGVFKPLHDAYYNGKLKAGMQVMYADSSGSVHTYSVLWWKLVRPTTAASWA